VARWVAPLVAVLAVGWIVLLLSAPFLPLLVSAAAYAFGSLVCHQIPERSFHLHAFQLPVCARCFGLYAGAAAAAMWTVAPAGLYDAAYAAYAPRTLRAVTAVAALPTVITVVLEWAGVWAPSNLTRALAGAPLGFVVAFVVMGAIRNEERR
jgi:uncharacterized membrane protein